MNNEQLEMKNEMNGEESKILKEILIKKVEISSIEVEIVKLKREVIDKFCPFKVGDFIYYKRTMDKRWKLCQIAVIYYDPFDDEYVDNKWRLLCWPCNKKTFKKMDSKYCQQFTTFKVDFQIIPKDKINTIEL